MAKARLFSLLPLVARGRGGGLSPALCPADPVASSRPRCHRKAEDKLASISKEMVAAREREAALREAAAETQGHIEMFSMVSITVLSDNKGPEQKIQLDSTFTWRDFTSQICAAAGFTKDDNVNYRW